MYSSFMNRPPQSPYGERHRHGCPITTLGKLDLSGDGKAASEAVKAACIAAGLTKPNNTMNGFGANGFSMYANTTEFNLRYDEKYQKLYFGVAVNGRLAGLKYEEGREAYGEDESITTHSPVNRESLIPRIKAVFESLGVNNIHEIRSTGFQTHWDDEVGYEVCVYLGKPLAKPLVVTVTVTFNDQQQADSFAAGAEYSAKEYGATAVSVVGPTPRAKG